MMKVYAFDFDGTITKRDTLIEFIRYAKGNLRFLAVFLLFSPVLVLMKLHLYPNYKAKQKLFSLFFKGMKIDDFDSICRQFAIDNGKLLREKALSEIADALKECAPILIVSASIDNWIRPFFDDYEGNKITVLGTKIETANGLITGRFISKNCYGEEKVKRIKDVFPNRNEYYLIAFGDSRGDKEMLEYADERHYKPFR